MTPSRLSEIGQALYGGRWKTPLARALGVDYQTVLDWSAGRTRITPARTAAIEAILARRRSEIDALTRLSS